MTQFYIDADNGNDANDGSNPTTQVWLTLHKFTEASRSAGDIATLRRGTTAQYDDTGQLDFTSDGTFGNPIIAEADYDDVSWTGGADFVNSSQTYTPIFGSKTMEASATITVIVAGEWVFNTTDGDDPREFSYEVKSVSGTTLTLHLPWKGSTGATKTLKVMPANPVWNDLSTAQRMDVNGDQFWLLQGINPKSSSSNSNMRLSNNTVMLIKDSFLERTTTSAQLIELASFGICFLRKCRTNTNQSVALEIEDGCVFDCEDLLTEGETSKSFVVNGSGSQIILRDCNLSKGITEWEVAKGPTNIVMRNTIQDTTQFIRTAAPPYNFVKSQDDDGVVGASYLFKPAQQVTNDPLVVEETTTVRSGGSNTSLKIAPSTGSAFSTAWELSIETLHELPIFATTASKKYEIFFRPDATANWTADPTAAEMWLEIEYWGHASNNYRRITKSTGTIDMNGSTTYTALDVTVAPLQAGVAFLRVKYGKPKESGKTNVFFIDPVPVIT